MYPSNTQPANRSMRVVSRPSRVVAVGLVVAAGCSGSSSTGDGGSPDSGGAADAGGLPAGLGCTAPFAATGAVVAALTGQDLSVAEEDGGTVAATFNNVQFPTSSATAAGGGQVVLTGSYSGVNVN
jgi:hypothetical protein